MLTQDELKQASVISRFSSLDAGEFERECERSWQALNKLKETVYDLVRDESLSPVQGIGILSCSTGQVFGYAEFHGQPSPADAMIRAWVAGIGSKQ